MALTERKDRGYAVQLFPEPPAPVRQVAAGRYAALLLRRAQGTVRGAIYLRQGESKEQKQTELINKPTDSR